MNIWEKGITYQGGLPVSTTTRLTLAAHVLGTGTDPLYITNARTSAGSVLAIRFVGTTDSISSYSTLSTGPTLHFPYGYSVDPD